MSFFPAIHEEEENDPPTRVRNYSNAYGSRIDSSVLKSRVIDSLEQRDPTYEPVRNQYARSLEQGQTVHKLQSAPALQPSRLANTHASEGTYKYGRRTEDAHYKYNNSERTPINVNQGQPHAGTPKEKERFFVEQTKKYKSEMEKMIAILDKSCFDRKLLIEKLETTKKELQKVKDMKQHISEEKLRLGTENAKITRKANELEHQLTQASECTRRDINGLQTKVEKFQKRLNDSAVDIENLKRKHQAELNDRCDSFERTKYTIERELNEHKSKLSDITVKLQQALHQKNEFQSIIEEKNRIIKRRDGDVQNQIEQERRMVKQLEVQLQQEMEKIKKLNSKSEKMDDIEAFNSELSDELMKANEARVDLTMCLEKEKAHKLDLERKVDELSHELDAVTSAREDLDTVVMELRHENQKLAKSLNEEKQELGLTKQSLTSVEKKLLCAVEEGNATVQRIRERERELCDKLDNISLELEMSQNHVRELQQEAESSAQNDTNAHEKIEMLNYNIEELNEEKTRLKQEMENKIQELQEKRELLENEIHQLKSSMDGDMRELRNEQESERQHHASAVREMEDQLTKQEDHYMGLKREFKEYASASHEREDVMKEENRTLMATVERLELDVASERNRVRELDQEVVNIKLSMADVKQDMKEEVSERDADIRIKSEKLQACMTKITRLEMELRQQKQAIDMAKENETCTKRQLTGTKERVEKLELTNHTLRASLEEEEINHQKSQSSLRVAQSKIERLADELDQSKKTLHQWSHEREGSRNGNKELKDQITNRDSEVDRLKKLMRTSEDKIDALKNDLRNSQSLAEENARRSKRYAGEDSVVRLQFEEMQTRYDTLKHGWDDMKAVLQVKDIDLKAYKKKVEQLERTANDSEKQKASSKKEQQALKLRLEQMSHRATESELALENTRKIIEHQRGELKGVRERLTAAESELSSKVIQSMNGATATERMQLISRENYRLKQANIDLINQSLRPTDSCKCSSISGGT
eukprot:CFRG1596T1